MRFSSEDIESGAQERIQMVTRQLVSRGIQDARILDAMRKVPRHLFIPPEHRDQAYEDHPVAIGCSQTISQPFMVAVMTEMLCLRPEFRVLEIGTGSGYQTAVLAELVGEVVTVERHAPLAQKASETLQALGYGHVQVVVGDGTLGCEEMGPYDAILVTAGAPRIPSALPDQLTIGGRLVAPVGGADMQCLYTVVRKPGGCEWERGLSCRFVPLVGVQGWGLG